MQTHDLQSDVKSYIMKEFLPGEDPAELTNTTPLISGGILDSIATVKLVAFLEDTYGIEFQPHEISIDHLDTLAGIASITASKIGSKN